MTVTVTVLYFARFRELLGRDQETLALEGVDTVMALRQHLAARGAAYADVFAGSGPVLAAVNEVMAHAGTPLRDGDVVAFFPMLTGG